MVKDWTRLCLGVGLMFAVAGAQAQAYPDRPVRLIVPFAAGGTTDFVARTIAPRLSELLGQPLVIENKGGGGTVIGTEVVARALRGGLVAGRTGVMDAGPRDAPALATGRGLVLLPGAP